LLVLAAALGGVSQAALAQGTAEVRGRVLADSARHFVPGADVAAVQLGLSALSDSTGRFLLKGLPAGAHLIVTRRPGFRPDSTVIELAAGETVVQDVRLWRLAPELEPVAVRATAGRYASWKMVGFEERRRQGVGQFLDRDVLEKNRARRTSDILASQGKGVDIRRGSKSRAWAVGGRATSSGKCALCRERVLEVLDPSDADAGARPACYMDVWLDGALVYDSSSKGAPLFDLNSIDPDNIEGIEIYTGAAQIPPRFNRTASGCGALVIWTRI
jgi:Carboxypeptidase regulatory-like domain/TonB-dependent Receptor Plug Domain